MPPSDESSRAESFTLHLADEAGTCAFGADLAVVLRPGDCVLLSGDLGAGKSTLARAVLRWRAGDPELDVPSPTFTLVQPYELDIPFAHFDFYRLGSPEEVDELGLDEVLERGVALIEWPERAEERLPEKRLAIRLEEEGAGRRATIGGDPESVERVRRSRELRAFLDGTGLAWRNRRYLAGDASARAYETIEVDGEQLVVMNAPPQSGGPILRDGKTYMEIAHIQGTALPFVALATHLHREGFAAPAVHAADLENGFLVLEHLGADGVLDAQGRPVEERYRAAIEACAALHRKKVPEVLPVPGDGEHRIPPFDRDAMMIEVSLLLDWYLPHQRRQQPTGAERARFETLWDELVARLSRAERSLVLRDLHSPNIIWRGDRSGLERVGLVDFQDAMIGPAAYDVAALVTDARVTMPAEMRRRLLDHYEGLRANDPGFSAESFREAYAIMAAQRNSKILGIFVRLKERDGKPGYVRHLPRITSYLQEALAHPVLAPLRAFYREAGIIPGESPPEQKGE